MINDTALSLIMCRHLGSMSTWFFKAFELTDGQWACRFGLEDLGTHPSLTIALSVMVEVAVLLGGRQSFQFRLQYLDGMLERRNATDPVPGEAGD